MKRAISVLSDMSAEYVQRLDGSILAETLPVKTQTVLRLRASPLQHALLEAHYGRNGGGGGGNGFSVEAHQRRLSDRPQELFASVSKVAAQYAAGQVEEALAAAEGEAARAEEELRASQAIEEEAAPAAAAATAAAPGKGELEAGHALALALEQSAIFARFGFTDPATQRVPCAKAWAVLRAAAWCAEKKEKLIVFSASTATLDAVSRDLQAQFGWAPGRELYRIDGKVAADKRQAQIEAFNKPGCGAHAFLISLLAGGVGINLVAATRMLLLDTAWNPAHITQAVHRFYRLGQSRRTYVYRLLADGWLEDSSVYESATRKEKMALRVVDKKSLARREEVEEGASRHCPPPPREPDAPALAAWAEARGDPLLSSLLASADGDWCVAAKKRRTLRLVHASPTQAGGAGGARGPTGAGRRRGAQRAGAQRRRARIPGRGAGGGGRGGRRSGGGGDAAADDDAPRRRPAGAQDG